MSATKRYYVGNCGLVQSAQGEWVAYADYLALQAALREALKDWEAVSTVYNAPRGPDERIAELRKFINDK